MSIADEKGKVYSVNRPEELLSAINNDELMAVLKYTFMSKFWNEHLKSLMDKGLIQTDATTNMDDAINELNDGVEYLKNHLSIIFSPEDVEKELLEVQKNMFGANPTINDN